LCLRNYHRRYCILGSEVCRNNSWNGPVVVGVCGRVGALSAVTELLTILESLAIYEIKPKLELFDDGILSQVNTPTKKNRIIISLYSMGKYSKLRKQNVN
jgi:hypothetical protein